ncbi:DNA primase [Vicingaceae bacterium]|nr:DNA primase [Vicingaceae bacterium]MDB4060947.1 DNA primase [Vicingaceae bacterium]MDC0004960.1 DNA primase [bacterium]MDC1450888.1 DNA primase [Vicingaceae bacterium]
MIPKETVNQIIETARIDEVVGDWVNLKKRGANMLGLCPFHNEKSPSFTVSPAKGIYKCFGCGEAGGAVNFVMAHEQYSYPEALKFLANKYNIEIEEEEQTPEQVLEANAKESLFIVNDFAATYFNEQLLNSENGRAIGLSYFKERGFREETIEKFKLGFSHDEWTNFTDAALAKGYNLQFLDKTGLTIVKDQKKFDRFKGRVMFPIQNISGRVIGFGGRTLSADKKVAKYLNSPESDIYHKSRVLYGLNLAKKSIISQDRCFLVEGYTDVISLHQNGIENVVSSSGTSLTADQIRLIKRYTQNITILFDGDTAGIKAAFRGIDMILEEGLNVRVLAFADGEDPDSFAKSHSTAEISEYLDKESFDFIRFKTNLLLKETGDDPIKRAGLIKEIVSSIALIPDPIARSVYLQECSNLMDIGEQALLSELNKVRRNKLTKRIQQQERDEGPPPDFFHTIGTPESEEKSTKIDVLAEQESDIIRTFIKYGSIEIEIPTDKESEGDLESIKASVAEYLVFEIEKDELHFNNPIFRKVYHLFKLAVENETQVEERHLVTNKDNEISSFTIECLMEKYTLSLNWEEKHKILTLTEDLILPKKIHKGICSWRLNRVEQLIGEKQQQLKGKNADYDLILADIMKLTEAKRKLAHELGRIILH